MAAGGPMIEAVIAAMNTEQGVWPENVELYEPCKDTILLTDAASCKSTEAYLRFCGLAYGVKSRRNAEFMSPTGNVPFLRADRELTGNFQGITSYIEAKGFSTSADMEMQDKAEMEAYISLIENSLLPAELYMLWWKKDWAARTRQQYGSQFPVPINLVLSYRKQWQVCQYLKAHGWHRKTEREVLEEFKQTCQALSEKLGNNKFFVSDRPTELDALVFGHLHAVLTRYLPDDSLSSVVRNHRNLEHFVMRILNDFFQ
ncbi:metaxin-2-like [Orbicella faveolata]|uniref:metaxin-2-like n=1 Tax=Orbicella faveolata TaxID=48498 RepID=UPI0009E422E1|nr:metaxin-2-like [Orbicella faveolata]